MKIVVTELIWPEGLLLLESVGNVVYDPELWCSEDLCKVVSDADAVIVRNRTRVTEELLKAAPGLQVVGRLGVGLDNIDLQAAKSRGVAVVFARNCNAVSVAEYVFAVMLSFARTPEAATADVKKGHWDRKRFTKMELYGKTLGMVGVGEIGARLAHRANAFGMQILGYDPFLPPYELVVTDFGVRLVSLEQLMAEADFISIHVPYNKHTHFLINQQTIGLMKPTAYLINSARGGVVDEDALHQALVSQKIAGAALDVFSQEPPLQSPLLELDNVIITPHIAGLTEEAQVKTSVLVANEVIKVLRGQTSLCVV